MTIDEELGNNIASQRAVKGRTQAEIAARSRFSRSSIANLETGRQTLAVKDLPGLAKAIGCRVADLLPSRWLPR